MNGEDAVTPGTGLVQFVLGYCAVVLPLEEHLECVFFCVGLLLGQSFDNNVPFGVLLDAHLILIIFIEQIR